MVIIVFVLPKKTEASYKDFCLITPKKVGPL